MCGVCFFLSESRVPFSNYAVATTVIWIDNQGQRKNGRKLGGETLLPLLVGKDMYFVIYSKEVVECSANVTREVIEL
jgi:hypothetical protein